MERPWDSVSCAAAWAAGMKKRGNMRPAKPRRNAERRVSAYEARERNLAIKVALQAKRRAERTHRVRRFRWQGAGAANAAEFVGHISMKKTGQEPGSCNNAF